MKRKDILYLVTSALIVAVISYVLASLIFHVPLKRSATVPVVGPISSSFPDIKNDPNYKAIFNSNALDPTQPIQIGNGQNATPFNTSQ